MVRMLRCKFQLLITFVLYHVIVDSEKNSLMIYEKVTWLEGQRQCAEKNGRLLSSDDFSLYLQEVLDKVSGDFWLGDIQKVSEWIHILGCYSMASIENKLLSPTNFTIALTPGRCQEYCFYEKMSLLFAIKEETCYCLESNFELPDTASVNNCEYSCNSDDEPKACGSKTEPYLSVYKTTNSSDNKNAMCLKIACSGINHYEPEYCDTSLIPYCSNNITGTGASWTAANAMCMVGYGNLDGDANLDEPTRKCNEIQNRLPNRFLFWLGIVRQNYNTTDKGYPTKFDSLKQCEFLERENSITMKAKTCSETKIAVCLVPHNSSTLDKTADLLADNDKRSDDDIGPLVGGVFGGLFLIASVFLLSIFIIRRRKKGRQEDQNALRFESETPTSISELKVNQTIDNGFNRYPEMNSQDTKEEAYYKSQDDYDILGKRRSKVKGTQSENIYNHAESTNQNCYASAAQVSKRISGEDLYDHTNNSEYGTVSAIDNDNMYSES